MGAGASLVPPADSGSLPAKRDKLLVLKTSLHEKKEWTESELDQVKALTDECAKELHYVVQRAGGHKQEMLDVVKSSGRDHAAAYEACFAVVRGQPGFESLSAACAEAMGADPGGTFDERHPWDASRRRRGVTPTLSRRSRQGALV